MGVEEPVGTAIMLNIIIPARAEYPQVVWTVYSVIEDVPKNLPFHVTVYSNGGDDEQREMDEWFNGGTLAKRGYLTVVSDKEAVHPYTVIQEVSKTLSDGLIMFC